MRSSKGGGSQPRRIDRTRIRRRFQRTPRLVVAFLLVASIIAVLLFVWTPPPATQTVGDVNAQARFVWVYSELLIDEALLLLAAVVLLTPLFERYFGSILSREILLKKWGRVLAMLGLVGGFLLFAFWVVIDLLGGYGGPGSVPLYNSLGLNNLPLWDKQGVIGFLAFFVSVLGFMALRAGRGIGQAVREGVSFFAAPILVVFELALWYNIPLDMYWHVTTFASWSLGVYLTDTQFSYMMQSGYDFVWAGNVYLVSNWLVLIVSSLLILISVLHYLNPRRDRVVRRRR